MPKSVPRNLVLNSQLTGKIIGELRSKGLTIGIADAIIAATALQFGVPLLTNNVEHYPFPNLKVIRGLEKNLQ